jgi:predicted amidohydrolase
MSWARRSPASLRELTQPEDGPSITRVSTLAARLGVGIGVGLLIEQDGWLFNSYAVCMPDGAVHIHRKLHASAYHGVSDGGAYTVFGTPWGVRIGVLICLGNNIVENVRATALLGAQILLAPHQTCGTHSMIPFAEDPIPVSVWENRATEPGAVEEACPSPRPSKTVRPPPVAAQ